MSYITTLQRVIYEFMFEGRSGPAASGINRWIQVKLYPPRARRVAHRHRERHGGLPLRRGAVPARSGSGVAG